ncbi:MAG: multidrug effflux MFS transporter [Hyphomonadaceae bacterium]|nr:multidrug effflux MFS transporter [Hyphomonadaceae bacterium]
MSQQEGAAPPPTLILGLALGFLCVLGPLSIDLYLPAMTTMKAEFATSDGAVQRTLSVFFLALACAQIPIGAFGDRFGRRLPLLVGLSVFIAASVGCAMAVSVDQLIVFRFLQGLGACAGTAVARAMIRDLRTGHEAAKLMAFSFLVIGISPVAAPLLGNLALGVMEWRGLFVMLAIAGVAALAASAMLLPESLPPEKRQSARAPILAGFPELLRSPGFQKWSIVTGLATTIPFAYVTAAPFVFSGVYGLPPANYTLLLALNAGASILATQFAPALMRRWGAPVLIRRASMAAFVVSALVLCLAQFGQAPLVAFQLYSMAIFAISGLMLTPAAITALDSACANAGAAAGLVGTCQLLITALASAVVSMFTAHSIVPLLSVLAAGLFVVAVLSSLTRAPLLADAPKPG